MLSQADNERLTQIGPGTPMGTLMRRYWHPVAAVTEFDERDTKPVRLMGEDLVLYRDRGGKYGLVDRHCPHRRADMSYGYVEECGLRCSYHGWLFDETGQCRQQPYEDMADPKSGFKDKVRIKAYPVERLAGLLWAYLGPEPRPLVPNWEPFTWNNGFVQIVFSEIPCNWYQCQENSIDPVHFEWMHSNWKVRLEGREGPYAPAHVDLAFDEFEWGFRYRRMTEATDENHPLWTIGRVCLWPNALFTGAHFEWRVPIDDENTSSVGWFFSRVPKDREPYVQDRIPYWYSPIRDANDKRWITSHIMNQDFVAWVGQGTIADRTQEHLGKSDRGIIMMRRRFLADLEAIEKGYDPKAIVRDPAVNSCIELPIAARKLLTEGLTRDELHAPQATENPVAPDRFPFLVGQPESVKRAYEEAMGVELREHGFVEGPRLDG